MKSSFLNVLKNFIPATRQFFEADLYTLTASSGQVLRFTACDAPITWQGNTYGASGPLISRSQMRWGLGLTVDTLTIMLDVTPAQTLNGVGLLKLLGQGYFDGARVALDRLYGTAFGKWVDSVTLFAGNIADVQELGRTRCKLQIRSRLELLNNSLPVLQYQPGCVWPLYSPGCGLTKSAFGVNGVYTATGSTTLVLASNLTQPDNYFDLGTLTFSSGPNNGISVNVQRYANAAGRFTLNAPLPNTPANGDTFTAYPGCDRMQATCSGKFNNLKNFLGFPYIPVPESAI